MKLRYLKQYKIRDMLQIHRNSKRPPFISNESMVGKFCILTGATSGVGLSTIKKLYAAGADILMVNRSREKSENLINDLGQGAKDRVSYILADLSSLKQAKEVVEQIKSLNKPIDLLINNAGMHSTKRIITPEGQEKVFALNHLSSYLITRELLPLFQKQNYGRIIQVNSQGHRFFGLNLKDLNWAKRPYMGLRAYGAAKTAQMLCTWEFADQLEGSNVTINAMHPGAVKSNIGQNNGPLYRWFSSTFLAAMLDDVDISGEALFYLASSPQMEGVSGKFFNLTHLEKPAPHGLDRELGKAVWNVSENILRELGL